MKTPFNSPFSCIKLVLWSLILCFLLKTNHSLAQNTIVLTIKNGATTKNWTLDSLGYLPVSEGKDLQIKSTSGEVRKHFRTYKGVLLKTLLERSGFRVDTPKEKGRYVFVVQAKDGYTTTFSYHELFNHTLGEGVYVLYEIDGKIPADGPLVLVSASDTITGARHVKWLTQITIVEL